MVLAILVGVVALAGACGSAEEPPSPEEGGSRESGATRDALSSADTERRNLVEVAPGGRPNPEVRGLVQTAAPGALPGDSVRLLSFPGVGRLVATCGRRPQIAFSVGDKTTRVGVDTGRNGMRVERRDPGQLMRTRLPSSAIQRWHIASSHSDGDRIVTVSVQVAPVIGGRGGCQFSAQSLRTGRVP